MRDGRHMFKLEFRERNGASFSSILLICMCCNKQYRLTTYDRSGQILGDTRFVFYSTK